MSPGIEHELRAHAQALRTLARDLVGEQQADDLAQDVAVQALRKPPRRTGSIAAWLATVARNLASKHGRSERRRRAREQRAARSEVLPPDTALADRETFRRLNEAVMALPEPYQGAILQRYLRDRPVAEIAAQTGVPVATVKTRLQRGLALLRQRLEREQGDWRAALGSAFGLRRVLDGIPVIEGVVMGAAAKFILGGAIVLLGAAAWWFSRPEVPVQRTTLAAPTDDAARTARAGAVVDGTPERREAPVAAPSPAEATIRGRCVDAGGLPLAACEVTVHGVPGSPGRSEAWQRVHGTFAWTDPSPRVTGGDGMFTLHALPSGPLAVEFQALAPGRASASARWSRLEAGDDMDLGDVIMRKLVRVRLRTVDGNQAALSDASVSFHLQHDGKAMPLPWQTVITDASGRAALDLAEGEHGILTSIVNASPGTLVVPGDRSDLDHVLELQGYRGVEFLGGSVRDQGGLPIANAFLWSTDARGEETMYWQRSAMDGRFVLNRPAEMRGPPLYLRCHADGYDAWASAATVAWGERNVDVVLQRGIAAEFRITDQATGTAVHDFDVVLKTRQQRRYDDYRARGMHRDGVVVFDPLPRGDYRLTVVPRDPDLSPLYFHPVRIEGSGPAVVDVALARAALRTLLVRHADGSPVAGARFELHGNSTSENEPHPGVDAWAEKLETWMHCAGDRLVLLHQDGTTDERGEAVLRGSADTLFAVRVTGAGNLPLVATDVSLAFGAPLVMIVAKGAEVRGRIGPDAFLARIRAATSGASRLGPLDGGSPMQVQLARQETSRTVPVTADGTFAASGLEPGAWNLTFRALCRDFTLEHPLASLTIDAQAVAQCSFDLSEHAPAHVAGTVTVDGEPPGLASVLLGGSQGRTDAEGRFELWTAPGRPALAITPQGSAMSLRLGEVVVAAGEDVERSFALRTGLLRVRLVDRQDNPVVVRVWVVDGAGSWRFQGWQPAQSTADGRLEQRFETGTFRLSTFPRSLQSEAARERFAAQHPDDKEALARQFVPLGAITVDAGNEAWRTIVLPPEWDR